MKLLKISLISFLAVFSLVLSPAVFAEEVAQPEIKSFQASFVKISDLELISQKGNEFKISFILRGGDKAESGIKYGISLFDKDETKKLDEFVYPEIITVEKGSEVKREITYKAPSSLEEGDYVLRVSISNNKAFILGISRILNINIPSSLKTAEIMTESCYLYETADKEKVKTLDLRSTMYSENPLSLFCNIKNLTKDELVVSPVYEIYQNSLYGEKIGESQKFEEITLLPDEERSVSWPMPISQTLTPQVVKIYLETNETYSNSITARYTLPTTNTTIINNLFLDKTFYKKGEEMNLSLLWSSSVDEKDITLKVSILNKRGQECLPEIIKNSPQIGNEEIKGQIVQRCLNPNVLIKIEDTEGNVLAEENLAFESIRKLDKALIIDIAVLALIIILVVAGIIIFFVKPKNKKEELKDSENINHENNQ
jgi:hypothetical protein